MSREKQIVEEMKKDLCECHTIDEWAAREYGEAYTDFDATAQKLIAKGWSKQREWISVEERLPEDTQMCLAYATVYFVPDHVDDCDHCEQIIVTKYYKEFGFMDWDVHYWMPLPEAPKGGE